MPRRTNKKEEKDVSVEESVQLGENSELEDQKKEFEQMKDEMQKQLEELKKEKEELDKEKEKLEKEKESMSIGKDKPSRKRKEVPNIDRNEMVLCRNLVEGSLVYVSQKTGLTTRWSSYGDEEYIEFGELMTMKSSQPRLLNEPWIAIEDDDVVNYLGLTHIYENIIPVDELEDFFEKDPVDISKTLDKVPNGTKSLVASKARKMVENNELYDNRVIKVLEKKLQIDLSMVQN